MFSTWDRLHHLPGKFALVRCLDCQLVRLSPRPVLDELSFYYPETDYYSYQKPAHLSPLSNSWRGRLKTHIRDSVMAQMGYATADLSWWQQALQPLFVAIFQHRIPYGFGKKFPRYARAGRALEIGCGSGAFLALLKQHGWQVAGIELSKTAAATAKREFDIEVFTDGLDQAPFARESFDYIHLSHVIEHLPDPVEALQTVRRWLKPTGTIYIETPNVDSFARRRLGGYWLNWDTPRHLCLFTPPTLTKTLTAAGLAVKDLSTTGGTHYLWSQVYRREEQNGQAIAGRPIFPNRPDLGSAASLRDKIFRFSQSLAHLYNPLSGDVLCCWATRRSGSQPS